MPVFERMWGFKSPLAHHCDLTEFRGQLNPQRLSSRSRLVVLGWIQSEMSDEVAASEMTLTSRSACKMSTRVPALAATETDVVHVTSIAKRHTSRLVDAITTHASLGEDGMSAT